MKSWDKIEKEGDGRTIPFEVTVPVKRGYIYFVRMGAKVKDSFEKHNYTEIVKIEVPQ